MQCWSASYNAILWQIRQNQKMSSIFPIFAGSVAWAAWSLAALGQTPLPLGTSAAGGNAPANPAAESSSGGALLRHVIESVDSQASISAKVRHRIDLLGHPLIGSGIYLQQGRGPTRALRFDLNLQTGEKPASVQQISDGKELWISEEVGSHTRLSRVDVARLARARPRSPLPPNAWLALGGLPKLLSGIESSFQFGTVAESRLEDLPVWTIEGTWNRGRLVQLLSDQKDAIEAGQPADLSKLAPNLPDRVVLHVGCDDFFPYRIEYWRAAHKSDAKAKADDIGRMILLMELYEVRLGANINPQEFAFKRGATKPLDRTQEFLDKLSLDDRLPEGAGQSRTPRR
jgi:hypothetical protein